MNKIRCECGEEWRIQENLSAYEGEIVLVCDWCGKRYFNAQEYFSKEQFENLEKIKIKGTENQCAKKDM